MPYIPRIHRRKSGERKTLEEIVIRRVLREYRSECDRLKIASEELDVRGELGDASKPVKMGLTWEHGHR